VSRRAPLIAVVVFVLVAILMVVFLVRPKLSDIGAAEDQLTAAEVEQLALQTELSRLQASAEDAARLRAELARARRAVPPIADLPGLINELQTAADVAGVDFFSIAPSSPVPVEGAQATEVPAQIQVIGGFFPVDEFLFRLETLPRSSKVVSLTVSEGVDGLPQIDVQLDVRFFTTDLQAGPGAPAQIAPEPAAPETSPTPETSPGETPAPEESPTTIPSPEGA